MSTGRPRAASAKLWRTSAPVKPVPSIVSPGSSVALAKAIVYRRGWASPVTAVRTVPAARTARATALSIRDSAGRFTCSSAGLAGATLFWGRLRRGPSRPPPIDSADPVDADEVAGQPDRARHRHVEE